MTKIPWTNETWNPVVGCTKIATGCKNCYAEKFAWRLVNMSVDATGGHPEYLGVVDEKGWTGKVQCCEHRLEKPLHWKKPRMIFVCSMGDLFHERVPFNYIDRVWGIMRRADWHIYQILTKRIENVVRYADEKQRGTWPNNIWLGTSISTQADADKNIPILLKIPAAIRFVSIEPMLEIIDLEKYLLDLDWVIIGCESGPKARLCSLEDIDYVIDQCKSANVPVFVKQIPINGKCSKHPEKWPAKYRIQEFPKKQW
jgi:protein gp37